MKIGEVVYSVAGRDKQKALVVIGLKEDKLLVVDGKERPLERPKAKSPRHLKSAGSYLEKENLKSNKSLRKALWSFNNEMNSGEGAKICLKKI